MSGNTDNKLTGSLMLSFVVSCVIAPILIIVLIFYYAFMGVSKSLLFGSIEIIMKGNTGFSFNLRPQLLIVIMSIFIITFLISYFIKKMAAKSKE